MIVLILLAFGVGLVVGGIYVWWSQNSRELEAGAVARRTRLLFSLAEGDREQVSAGLEALCTDEPMDMGALLTLAALDRRRGRFERAKTLHRTVLAAAELSSEYRAAAFFGLGRDLLAQGRARAAVGALARAASLAPRSPTFLAALARALEKAGAWERAATEWERLEKISDGIRAREARLAQGRALAGLAQEALEVDEEPRKAQKVAERAIALAPESGFAWCIRARAESAGGSNQGAFEAWQKALLLAPHAAGELMPEALAWADRAGLRQELLKSWRLAAATTPNAAVLAAGLAVPELSADPILTRALERLSRSNMFATVLWADWLLHHERADEAKALITALARKSLWICRECDHSFETFNFACSHCGGSDTLNFALCVAERQEST